MLAIAPLGERLPSAGERAAANQLRQILASRGVDHEQTLRIVEDSGQSAEVVLTPGISSLLIEVLRHIGKGDAVTLVPVSQMLSTQQAADILNVSRPFLISLLEKDDIPHVLVGRHDAELDPQRAVMRRRILSLAAVQVLEINLNNEVTKEPS